VSEKTPTLTDLRAELDGVDDEIRRTKRDKAEAIVAFNARLNFWGNHLAYLRTEHARIVDAIKRESQRLRGRLRGGA